jgi:hypothetical protein
MRNPTNSSILWPWFARSAHAAAEVRWPGHGRVVSAMSYTSRTITSRRSAARGLIPAGRPTGAACRDATAAGACRRRPGGARRSSATNGLAGARRGRARSPKAEQARR